MKRWLSLFLKIGVSAGILALIASKTDLGKIAGLLTSVGSATVGLIVGLGIVQTLFSTYRWVLVTRALDGTVEAWPALQAVYVSLALNQCTPSYVGGDAYRIYWLYREGNRLVIAARGVVIDRISAIIVLVLMMAAGLPLVFVRFPEPAARTGLVAVLACGLLGTTVFLACDAVPTAWRRLRLVRELAELSAAARPLLLHSRSALVIGPLALVVHLLTAAVMYVFAASLRLPLTFLDCVLLMPPIMLLAAIPVSIAGWGVREGVVVGALSMVGIGTEPALALSLLLGAATLGNAVLGLLPLVFGGERFGAGRVQLARMPEA